MQDTPHSPNINAISIRALEQKFRCAITSRRPGNLIDMPSNRKGRSDSETGQLPSLVFAAVEDYRQFGRQGYSGVHRGTHHCRALYLHESRCYRGCKTNHRQHSKFDIPLAHHRLWLPTKDLYCNGLNSSPTCPCR